MPDINTTPSILNAEASRENPRICGIVVTFYPSPGLVESLAAIRGQIDHLLIVDNGSDEEGAQLLTRLQSEGVSVIRNPENLGIATALNIGVNWARSNGYNWVLTLDQDTICEPDMVAKMLKVYWALDEREKVAILAPIHYDREANYISAELRNLKGDVSDRDYVMTSGNLIPISVFDKIGPYDDDFFIEYVDHDFCLRAKRRGLRILLVREAKMAHRLGDMRMHTFGSLFSFFSHNYHPVRRYYRGRNRIVLYRRYFGRWIFHDQEFAVKDMFKILLVEKDRWAKIKATLSGTIDGLLSRLGRFDGATYTTPKAPKYFVEFREEILPLLPQHSARALDMGCGSGETSAQLKKIGRFGWVCGVEGNPDVARIAQKNLDQVLVGDIESMKYPFEAGSIDTIMTLDILEHLVDPWKVLGELKYLLKPGGRLVVSIPNVRHYSATIPLVLLGDWRYQQEGILDSTHLRFFTRKTTIKMLQAAGFEIEILDHTGAKRGLGHLVNLLTFGLLKEFFIFQNLIACRKPLASARPEKV
jgi:rhamnosyltransferase